jgi:hypothetical protein
MKRFLGMSPEEIAENERMWKEENIASTTTATDAAGDLRGVGITPSAIGAEQEGQAAEAPEDMAAAAEGGAEAPPPETPAQ